MLVNSMQLALFGTPGLKGPFGRKANDVKEDAVALSSVVGKNS